LIEQVKQELRSILPKIKFVNTDQPTSPMAKNNGVITEDK
jgi:hypothetical protein